MAVRWQIPFQALRSKTVYTVNIYDNAYSGSPVVLKGAAQTFTTEEDGDEDFFAFVRTQSGYIRIIDDGKDANGNAFNYRDLLPTTDTDRPVELRDDKGGTVVWQGYMQAQNFGSRLYGGKQVREFPVQCPLTVLSRLDVDITNTSIRNFAYLLLRIIQGVPTLNINRFVIQGGAAAQIWLTKCIDWQVFAEEDNDGNLKSKYNLLEALEAMCAYWGWTARTQGTTLYLMRPDDAVNQQLLTIDGNDLSLMMSGTNAGSIGSMTSRTVGDVLTDTEAQDIQMRGPSKAVVRSSSGDDVIMQVFPKKFVREMYDGGMDYFSAYVGYKFTYDKYSFDAGFMSGTTWNDNSFNMMYLTKGKSYSPVIRIKSKYNGSTKARLETKFSNSFYNGVITLKFKIYVKGEAYTAENDNTESVAMAVGVGETYSSAKWWRGNSWSDTRGDFIVWTNQADSYSIPCLSYMGINPKGKVFVEFLGSEEIDGEIDIADFTLEFEKQDSDYAPPYMLNTDSHDYEARTNTNTYEEWSSDNVFASNYYSIYGHNLVLEPDGKFYSVPAMAEYSPEQRLANRVVAYWATSKRRIEASMKADIVEASGMITPAHTLTIDSTKMYPVAISHDWWNDVLKVSAMQL